MATPKFGELELGKEYLTILCSNNACKQVVPIANAGEVYIPSSASKSITIGCPFCGNSDSYALATAENRVLKVLPPTAQ